MEFSTAQMLLSVVVFLSTYLVLKWWKNPLRLIPGPDGVPLLGNALSINPDQLHTYLYNVARKYGPVTKLYILNSPIVIINSAEACLEALVKKGTDFNGRPPVERVKYICPNDLIASSIEDRHHQPMRKLFTKAMKAYGPGIGHLENIMHESMLDIVDELNKKEGETIDIKELCNGYVCCVIASMMFGEKYNYNDPTCQFFHQLNLDMKSGTDPYVVGQLLDLFPVLFNFPFILSGTQKHLRDTSARRHQFFQNKIDEAREQFGKSYRGCIDLFIQNQVEDVDENGKPILDDTNIQSIMVDFLIAGMETSFESLSQAFLDLLHDPILLKRLQTQIDEEFEPAHRISARDREKLPLLNAFIHENLRYLSVVPLMVPHMTIRDTEVAGYKIPAHTRVLMNSYHMSHDPDVYEDPFTFKIERFLDEDGKFVSIEHPARAKMLAFGSGRRQCPGEVLAQTRIFIFLASILQKFDIEPVGELPDRDVRKYKMGVILSPPPTYAKFIRRQQ